MKKIHLVERGPKGTFIKNQGYFYNVLQTKVIKESGGYFKNILLGAIRRHTLKKVFAAFEKLTNKDLVGKGNPE